MAQHDIKEVNGATKDPPTGHEIFCWPEFQALARRMGMVINVRTTKVTLVLEQDKVALIQHEYQSVEAPRPPEEGGPIPTTCFLNAEWKTFRPNPRPADEPHKI